MSKSHTPQAPGLHVTLDLLELLTPSEAGKALGVSLMRVRQLAAAGQLPCVLTKHGMLFTPQTVERKRQERAARTRLADNHARPTT